MDGGKHKVYCYEAEGLPAGTMRIFSDLNVLAEEFVPRGSIMNPSAGKFIPNRSVRQTLVSYGNSTQYPYSSISGNEALCVVEPFMVSGCNVAHFEAPKGAEQACSYSNHFAQYYAGYSCEVYGELAALGSAGNYPLTEQLEQKNERDYMSVLKAGVVHWSALKELTNIHGDIVSKDSKDTSSVLEAMKENSEPFQKPEVPPHQREETAIQEVKRPALKHQTDTNTSLPTLRNKAHQSIAMTRRKQKTRGESDKQMLIDAGLFTSFDGEIGTMKKSKSSQYIPRVHPINKVKRLLFRFKEKSNIGFVRLEESFENEETRLLFDLRSVIRGKRFAKQSLTDSGNATAKVRDPKDKAPFRTETIAITSLEGPCGIDAEYQKSMDDLVSSLKHMHEVNMKTGIDKVRKNLVDVQMLLDSYIKLGEITLSSYEQAAKDSHGSVNGEICNQAWKEIDAGDMAQNMNKEQTQILKQKVASISKAHNTKNGNYKPEGIGEAGKVRWRNHSIVENNDGKRESTRKSIAPNPVKSINNRIVDAKATIPEQNGGMGPNEYCGNLRNNILRL